MPYPIHHPFPIAPTETELRVARALASRPNARIICGAYKPSGFRITDGQGWTADGPGPRTDTIRNLLQRGWIVARHGAATLGRLEYHLTLTGLAAVKAVSE